jgi:hypothetical protein
MSIRYRRRRATGLTIPERSVTNEARDEGAEAADAEQPFSQELEDWLESDAPKSIGSMTDAFAEKSFAVVIMLLLFPSALPIPTGGITDIFAVIAALVALEMIIGARTIWLPKRLRHKEVGGAITGKAVPFIIKRIRTFERWSRPRLAPWFSNRWFARLHGVLLLACATGTIVAPPFSGLDTLPALGGIAIALSIILEDVLILGIGTLIGAGGLALIVTLGAAAARLFKSIF